MQIRGRQAAENRALARSKDSGEVGGFHGGRPVSNSIHPSVLAQEVAALHARLDLFSRHPRSEELRSRDNPVGSAGDSGHFFFDCPV
jgi:hypothetical protein